MKKLLFLLAVLLVCFSACKQDNYNAAKQATADDAKIQSYIKAKKIDAIKDSSGLYYKILTPGTGKYPTATSVVSVKYTGQLLNGSIFDSGNLSNTPLAGLIRGWQTGIPHINTGGRILLLIPSTLGYGNNSPGDAIPANSVLVFTIDLNRFQ